MARDGDVSPDASRCVDRSVYLPVAISRGRRVELIEAICALRAQAAALDRLLTAVSDAYVDEQHISEPAGGGGPALPATLRNPSARRARECLMFLAERGRRGLSPSNREIAVGVGVAHASQISSLLSYLEGEGLVSKRSAGAGKRNEWWLTARGEAVARELQAER